MSLPLPVYIMSPSLESKWYQPVGHWFKFSLSILQAFPAILSQTLAWKFQKFSQQSVLLVSPVWPFSIQIPTFVMKSILFLSVYSWIKALWKSLQYMQNARMKDFSNFCCVYIDFVSTPCKLLSGKNMGSCRKV